VTASTLPVAPAVGSHVRGISLRFDAVAALTVILILLVGLPAGVVIPGLSSVGTPAILAGLLALFWWALARLVPELGAASGWQPARIVLFVFAGSVLASFAAAMARPMTDLETRGAYRGLITAASWAGTALLAMDGIQDRDRLEVLLRRLVAVTTLLAVVGVLQFFIRFDLTALYQHLPGLAPSTDLSSALGERSSFRRVEATTGHPIEFSVVLAMILPVAVHFASTSRSRWRLIRWLGVAMIAMGIIMSVSRSGILGLAVAGLAVLWGWSWRRRVQALIAAGAFIGLVYVAIPGMVGTLRSLFLGAGSDPSVTGRMARYTAAANLIDQAPIFGRGFRTLIPAIYFLSLIHI